MKKKLNLVTKAMGASLLIALGDIALLKLGNPIGPVIFALGLLGVCYMGLNLFTGKCGFLFKDKMSFNDLMMILLVNLVTGYLIGYIYNYCDSAVVANALSRVNGYEMSFAFFIKSVLCGVVMYIAVYLYRKNTPLGIIYGIPLFIFCAFQHCIANIITLGVAHTFSWTIVLCIIGNFLGSLLMWLLSENFE